MNTIGWNTPVAEAVESNRILIESLESQLVAFYAPLDTRAGAPVAPVSAANADPFISQTLRALAPHMTRAEADALPYGAIKLDDTGKILLYNLWEAELAGFDPNDAEGSNFFTELAPCTNNRLFYGRFREGIAANVMDVVFPYTFTYRMRPTLVIIHLLRSDRVNWLFVNKR
jgi:photoactive yellow protein